METEPLKSSHPTEIYRKESKQKFYLRADSLSNKCISASISNFMTFSSPRSWNMSLFVRWKLVFHQIWKINLYFACILVFCIQMRVIFRIALHCNAFNSDALLKLSRNIILKLYFLLDAEGSIARNCRLNGILKILSPFRSDKVGVLHK